MYNYPIILTWGADQTKGTSDRDHKLQENDPLPYLTKMTYQMYEFFLTEINCMSWMTDLVSEVGYVAL